MGLNKDVPDYRNTRGLSTWILPGSVVLVAALLALTGEAGRELLRYERAAIAAGEAWRLLSGHFMHLGWPHFALNAAGLLLVWYLVGARFSAVTWTIVGSLSICGIDTGFWLLQPQLQWYVGLSGLLHGLLAAGIVAGLRARQQEAWLLGGILIAKIGYEQLFGPVPGSVQSTGGTVIVAAHLYGAMTGAVAGALLPVRVQAPASL